MSLVVYGDILVTSIMESMRCTPSSNCMCLSHVVTIIRAIGKCLIGHHPLNINGETGENIKVEGCSSQSKQSERE